MTTPGSGVTRRVMTLCTEAEGFVADPELRAEISQVRLRLSDPLRVALAGRVKAGKSTLLNALVGERLAPTDARECTLIPSWYRDGLGYDVQAETFDGRMRSIAFSLVDGHLNIALDPAAAADIERIVVEWPSARLRQMVLVDLPGIGSMRMAAEQRSVQVLGVGGGGGRQVDAVIYLMRHLHALDARLLEAFLDPSVPDTLPVNAVAVLSRADEVGGGRVDAMTAARRIAARYASAEPIRRACAGVVAVCGLLAETAATLRESEAAALRAIATSDSTVHEQALLSADRFVEAEATLLADVDDEVRRRLLDRFGLFGVRTSIGLIRAGVAPTASALSAALLRESGIEALIELIRDRFATRAELLKSRSALVQLRVLAGRLDAGDASAGARLRDSIARVEASSHELAEVQLLDRVNEGTVSLTEAERNEVLRVAAQVDPAARLGLSGDPPPSELRHASLERVDYWRTRGAHPLSTAAEREVAEVMARSYEVIHAASTRT